MTAARRRRRPTAKRIRFVKQWVRETGSDHRVLFVHVQIRGRRGPWVDVLLVSVNMGGRFTAADLRGVLREAQETGILFVIGLQEAGDQLYIPDIAEYLGVTYLGGDQPGEHSTPMLVSADVEVLVSQWRQIIGRVNVGRGAGPSWAKPKGIRWTRLRVRGVTFRATSFHEYASQQHRHRYLWALRLARPIIALMHRVRAPFFLIGDSNSDDDQPFTDWLVAHGITTNHRQLGEIATHGNRSIDLVACPARMVLTTRPATEEASR